MKQHSHSWMIRVLARDTFFSMAALWLFLLLLESLKPGIVSNYFSLPRALVALAGLCVLALALEQPAVSPPRFASFSRADIIALSLVSIGVGAIIFFLTNLGILLTMGLIFVTLIGLWAGAWALHNPE